MPMPEETDWREVLHLVELSTNSLLGQIADVIESFNRRVLIRASG